MKQLVYRFLIELTNGRISSSILKGIATSRLSKGLIPSFIKIYNINQKEMAKDIREYQSLHEFFTRRLKDSAREINMQEDVIISPVDAVMEEYGYIDQNTTMKVKGKTYSVSQMLGEQTVLEKYIGGTFIVLYLSPSHYHRIHSPVAGVVTKQWRLGRKSYPVNKLGLKYGKYPLSQNYRMITEVKHQFGHIAIVKVGAMFVNSIEKTHQGDDLVKGEELAYFTFGSTVVLLFEKETFMLQKDFDLPVSIKMGEKIGHIYKQNNS